MSMLRFFGSSIVAPSDSDEIAEQGQQGGRMTDCASNVSNCKIWEGRFTIGDDLILEHLGHANVTYAVE